MKKKQSLLHLNEDIENEIKVFTQGNILFANECVAVEGSKGFSLEIHNFPLNEDRVHVINFEVGPLLKKKN